MKTIELRRNEKDSIPPPKKLTYESKDISIVAKSVL